MQGTVCRAFIPNGRVEFSFRALPFHPFEGKVRIRQLFHNRADLLFLLARRHLRPPPVLCTVGDSVCQRLTLFRHAVSSTVHLRRPPTSQRRRLCRSRRRTPCRSRFPPARGTQAPRWCRARGGPPHRMYPPGRRGTLYPAPSTPLNIAASHAEYNKVLLF